MSVWTIQSVGDLTVGDVTRRSRVRVAVGEMEVAGPLRCLSAGPFGGPPAIIGTRTVARDSLVVHLTVGAYEFANLEPDTPCEVLVLDDGEAVA